MINYADAMDEIRQTFVDKWEAESASIVGYIPEVRYANLEKKETSDGSKYWVRVSVQTASEEQSTLSNCEGLPGQKRFTNFGIAIIQIFCPKSDVRSNELGEKLAMLSRNAYRGKATKGRVWFRNTRIQELAPEELFYRFNVVTEYEYDELA